MLSRSSRKTGTVSRPSGIVSSMMAPTARSAIRSRGWATVVRAGIDRAPSGTPSKPTTETSSGTRLPFAVSQSIAKSATRSDMARSAVGASGPAKSAAMPASMLSRSGCVS